MTRTIVDYGKPAPSGFAYVDPTGRAIVTTEPRCVGSHQQTLDTGRGVCPVCDQRVNVETVDGRPQLVEHRPTPRGAEPVTIGLGL